MKKLTGFLFVLVMVFGVVGTANASLQTIGTATYLGSDYNLIYEGDSIDGGLVWLDYTDGTDSWQRQRDWASVLGSYLTVNLDLGYTTDIDWSTGWRLPLTQEERSGYNYNSSEMGHLYYDSLEKPALGPLGDTSPFDELHGGHYWSGTENSENSEMAWVFLFDDGDQIGIPYKVTDFYALAVHPGTVDPVPIPSAMWLLGSGLIGLVGFRKCRKG